MHLKSINSAFFLLAFALSTASYSRIADAADQLDKDNSRGGLLYSLHCVSCHNENVHWMANKKVSDWPSLVLQVKLWQSISNLKWDKNDIDSVARHLNTLYYHYPVPNTIAQKK